VSLRWYVIRRILWTVFAAYLVLSGGFFVFAYSPDPNEVLVQFGSAYGAAMEGENVTKAQQEALQAYRSARNYDEPVFERYVDWMIGYATLNWGYSFARGKPVIDLLAETLPVTAVYLLPAILLSTLGGIAIGLYAAIHRGGIADYIGTSFAYAGLGLPIFFLGEAAIVIAIQELGWYTSLWDSRYGLWSTQNLSALVLPGLVMTANLLAVQVRYARSETMEYVPEEFVKTLRASGASTRDVARHVLRNAAMPLVSVFFTETLTVLFVSIYVLEVVFGLPGVGSLFYEAIFDRDIGVILASIFLPVMVGLVGNLIQDVGYTALDPRVEYGED